MSNPSAFAPLRLGTKILAVGRNYAAHAKEMGAAPPSSSSFFFFTKPLSSVITEGQSIEFPAGIGEVHHEVELGVVIGRRARRVSSAEAMEHVAGYTLALDMTARDIQAAAKKAGIPWDQAKCRDTFTPLGGFIPAKSVPDPHALELFLRVDGETRQEGSTADMITPVPDVVSKISHVMTLEPGDIILTGTPEGVGPVLPGQVITAGITGLLSMEFPVSEIEA